MRFLLPALLLASCAKAQSPTAPFLIPLPVEMTLTGGACSLQCPWSIQPDRSVTANLLNLLGKEVQVLHPATGVKCEAPLPITLHLINPDTILQPEWYSLTVNTDGIGITAVSEEGLFRGSRTLIQLLEQGKESASIPCLKITDQPRFPWRGMHLDPCRHFWSVEFTKKYIDLLARYKMNSFHWHLTDDQGWRIEIKKHPKLTQVGAWRKGSQVGPYSRREYDTVRYGGFYTQDEIREVVAYAAARHINVVPEIEMPGHALAALAAYPHLGCTGGPYEVNKGWGVFEDVFCAGNDSTFAMLEDVLTEVMELFPSEIIHIGGDECPKEQWKVCAKCQARKKAHGLKDEHELQSYFIQRIEKFVNSKGRKIIGWDEILEGGLAPNAAVMSWRGTEGGIAAAKQKHNVVMCPGSHCYFDHYQGDPANEPLAIGGFTTVQKVYDYEPIPNELTAQEGRYILGAQGNIWTEYILTPEHVEYMAVPRMLALAEVLWTPKEKRNQMDFMKRLDIEFPRLEEMKVNASKSLYTVGFKLSPGGSGAIKVDLICPNDGLPVLLDADNIGGTLFAGPMSVTNNRTITAACRNEHGQLRGSPVKRSLFFNKATAQKISLSEPPNERYNEGGAFTLVDGISAQEKRVNTEWLGWRKGVTITIDLGIEQDISYIGIGALNETYSWIHAPKSIEFEVSTDGRTYTSAGVGFPSLNEIPVINADPIAKKTTAFVQIQGRHNYRVEQAMKARYVRLRVQHIGNIPPGNPGSGNPAWLFLDEVEIR